MALRDIAIWNRKSNDLDKSNLSGSFQLFQNEIDRFFDGFFNDFGRFPASLFKEDSQRAFSPKVDISDNESSIEIAAELPGMDEKDIQVSLKEDVLTIKGEKKHSEEKKETDYYRVERSFGSFERSIRVPNEIEVNDIKASFKNGVLNISLPKSEKGKEKSRQIQVNVA